MQISDANAELYLVGRPVFFLAFFVFIRLVALHTRIDAEIHRMLD